MDTFWITKYARVFCTWIPTQYGAEHNKIQFEGSGPQSPHCPPWWRLMSKPDMTYGSNREPLPLVTPLAVVKFESPLMSIGECAVRAEAVELGMTIGVPQTRISIIAR